MDGNEKEEIGARLAREGVPQSVIEHVSKYSLIGSYDVIVAFAFVFFMAILFTLTIFLASYIENIKRPNVLIFSNNMNGVLYNYSFYSPLFASMPGALFISIALAIFTTLSSPNWQATDFVKDVAAPKQNWFTRWLLGRMMARLATETDPARYVRRFVFTPAWFLTGAAALLFAMSVPLAMLQVRAFEVFTPEGYYVSPLLPWNTPRFRPWAAAVSVETGCSHSSGKGTTDRMIYEVTFDDGTVMRLADATPVEDSWLDGMEVIHWNLRISGVQFVQWTWLWNDPFHPRCIRALRDRYSAEEFERLRRLLRVPY